MQQVIDEACSNLNIKMHKTIGDNKIHKNIYQYHTEIAKQIANQKLKTRKIQVLNNKILTTLLANLYIGSSDLRGKSDWNNYNDWNNYDGIITYYHAHVTSAEKETRGVRRALMDARLEHSLPGAIFPGFPFNSGNGHAVIS